LPSMAPSNGPSYPIVSYRLVGNGWCVDSKGDRLNIDGYSWRSVSVESDGSAPLCEEQCESDFNCIGYMTEDSTKCDIISITDTNAMNGIAYTDNVVRNYCWQKIDKLRDNLSSEDLWEVVTIDGEKMVKSEGFPTASRGHYDYYIIGKNDGQAITMEQCALLGLHEYRVQGAEYVRGVVYNAQYNGGRCDIESDDGFEPAQPSGEFSSWTWTSSSVSYSTAGPVTATKSVMGHANWWTFIYDGIVGSDSELQVGVQFSLQPGWNIISGEKMFLGLAVLGLFLTSCFIGSYMKRNSYDMLDLDEGEI